MLTVPLARNILLAQTRNSAVRNTVIMTRGGIPNESIQVSSIRKSEMHPNDIFSLGWESNYYYWYYYFYWYYEEYTTTLWFTTSATFTLDGSYSTVFTLPSTPPTPSIAPPTRLAIVPPSDTSVLLEGSIPTATGGPNAAGNLPEGGSDFSTPTIPSATLLATY